MQYFRILLSPLVPGGYSLPEDLQVFFVCHVGLNLAAPEISAK